MKRILTALMLAGLAGACAKQPGAIKPVDIPSSVYVREGCAKLRRERSEEKATLATLSAAQSGAAMGDALGVILIGIPISSLGGGDQEAAISISKGKILGMENAMARKGCR